MKRIALIPTYNPQEIFLYVIQQCIDNFEIVVVNDGSDREYDPIFARLPEPVHLLSYVENKGKGHALKTGLDYIKKQYEDEDYVVITIDDDAQHKIEDALKVVAKAEENPDSLILGSRFLSDGHPKKSRIGNFFARNFFRLLTKKSIYDTQTGLRAFTKENIDLMLSIPGDRYEYETNVLLFFARHDLGLIEEPIDTVYLDDNKLSHYNPWKDTLRIIWQFLKFSSSSLLSFLLDYGLYSLFLFIFPIRIGYKLFFANVLARIISATFNFTMNMLFVFKMSKQHVVKYALKYFILAICILALNTVLLELLANQLKMNEYLAKIIVEASLFIISFFVQKLLIFRSRKTKK